MSMRFEGPNGYRNAFNYAVKLARELNRETGLYHQNEFGYDGYNVCHLPKPENRYGFELRCQIVKPDEPLMD